MLLDVFQNRLVYSGVLVCETALRVGAGRSSEPIGTDLPVIKDAQSRPFIPGSSLKGVLRTRAESFVRAVHNDRQAACNPVGEENEWCINRDRIRTLIDLPGQAADEAVENESCLVCQVFGSPWLASKVQVRDALMGGLWFGQYQVRDGVAINRDTQTAEDGLKYDYEVVPAQSRFDFKLIAENLTAEQVGLLCVGLRPFERGEIGVGGFRSRGLGTVRLQEVERRLFAVHGNPERLFRFLDGDTSPEVWETLSDEVMREQYIHKFYQCLGTWKSRGGTSDAQATPE